MEQLSATNTNKSSKPVDKAALFPSQTEGSNYSPLVNFRKYFITVGIVIIILMVLLVGVLAAYQKIFEKQQSLGVNLEEINYPSLLWKERVISNADAAASEKDYDKRFELYRQIFADVLAVYMTDRDLKTREKLEILVDFISDKFPDLYEQQSFVIPCLDSSCGSASYTLEIEKIKNDLQNAENFDPVVLKSVQDKLDAAAISKDSAYQWQSYLGAFQEIKGEAVRTGDEKTRRIGLELANYLKSKYPSFYSSLQKQDPNVLEI